MIELIDTDNDRTFIIKEPNITINTFNIENILSNFIRDDDRDVIIDLTNVARIDSLTISALFRLKDKLNRQNREIYISNPGEAVMRVIELAGMENFIL